MDDLPILYQHDANASLAHIRTVNLGPTDVIVVEVNAPITRDHMGRIKAALQEVWPNHKSLILGPEMRLTVLSEAETED